MLLELLEELWLRLRPRLPRIAIAVGLVGAIAYPFYWSHGLLRVEHLPATYERRAQDFWPYVTGAASPLVFRIYYRINDSDWRRIYQYGPRAPRPDFTIEIPVADLRAGENQLAIRATAPFRPSEEQVLAFGYDPSPVALPRTRDWKDVARRDLDSQDGRWETFESDLGWRVRPQPGHESYDRILAITGAFAGGRRVETDVVFHHFVGETEWGFGLLPMWGGHPESGDHLPRRGWVFSLAWFWDRYRGFGNEFSYTFRDDGNPSWVNGYRNLRVEEGARYHIRAEVVPEVDAAGRHQRYRQKLWWWKEGDDPPNAPLELADTEGTPLPPREYAVAIMSYNAVVDFGPVKVEPLPTVRVPTASAAAGGQAPAISANGTTSASGRTISPAGSM